MPNTSVGYTPGAGANIDTFTQASGDHRQAMVVGDPTSTEAAEVLTAAMATRPGRAAAAAVTSVTAAAVDTQLLASNASRIGAMLYNDSTADVNVKYGSGASSTSYTVKIPPNGYWEMPPGLVYTGQINGIWTSAVGAMRCTELT